MKWNTIIKLTIFVAIFYALLALNVFRIGEVLAPSTKNYLDENIPTENKYIEEEYFTKISVPTGANHGAAEQRYEAMIRSLCNRINICHKISLNGEFSSYDTFAYTRGTIALIEFIDKHGKQETTLKDTIKKIDINKDTGTRRGYATRDTIIINLGAIQSKKEFAELLAHEMGHIVDLGYLQGIHNKKDKNFTEFGRVVFAINDPSFGFYKLSRDSETIRKAESKRKDFCSGYGMTNPFEDFSECFNLYLNHNIFFREIVKKNTTLTNKYNFIAGLVDGKYMASNDEELELIKKNKERRPRDTTKLLN